MIDTNTAVRSWLLSVPEITTLVGQNIFWPMLPQDFNPDNDGRAITVSTRGGRPDAEVPVLNPSIQIVVWASSGEFVQANEVDRAIYDAIHGKCGVSLGADGHVLSCLQEVQGQPGVDPETGWATITSFYRLMMVAA